MCFNSWIQELNRHQTKGPPLTREAVLSRGVRQKQLPCDRRAHVSLKKKRKKIISPLYTDHLASLRAIISGFTLTEIVDLLAYRQFTHLQNLHTRRSSAVVFPLCSNVSFFLDNWDKLVDELQLVGSNQVGWVEVVSSRVRDKANPPQTPRIPKGFSGDQGQKHYLQGSSPSKMKAGYWPRVS